MCYLSEMVYSICTRPTVHIYEMAAKESISDYGYHLLFIPQ